MRVYRNTILALAMAAFMCGCEPPPASEPDEPADQTSDALDVGGVDAMSARRAKPRDTESDRQPVAEKEPLSPPVTKPDAAQQETVTKANVGVGKKGRGYGGGFVSEPAKVYFNVRERAVFQIQVPQALNTYKAMDSRGKGPKDSDEFMEKVIKQNGIRLPELPSGQTYEYDPETEELMVRRPTN